MPEPGLSEVVREWVLPRVLERQARDNPGQPYLEIPGQQPVSFGEMEHRTRRVANALAALGVGFGDPVALMLPNSAAFIETWLAVARLGAVLVPLNTAWRGDLLRHVLHDCGARLVIAGTSLLPALAECGVDGSTHTLVVVAEVAQAAMPEGAVAFATLHAGPDTGLDVLVAVHDLAAILYTSGTTGRSKGVRLPHGHLHLDPQVYIEQLGLTADDVLYTCLPLFHANALLLGAYAALILGSRLVLAPRFSASAWLGEIRRSGATVTNLLGAMTGFIFNQPERDDDAGSALRVVVAVPTSPVQGPLFEQRFGVRLVELYGTTEVNCPVFQNLHEERRPGSCGRLADRWYECRLVDPQTDLDVAPGQPGEFVVRNKAPWTFMMGYHNSPQETLHAWRNLWFHTGDVLRRDADGYFYFVDRLKDSIRRRGENISAFEVEEVLLAHPDIAEAAVVGIPSPLDPLEQEVKACIVLRPGRTLDPVGLTAHCAGRMADFMVPRYIEAYSTLPRTATDKVMRTELRTHGVRDCTWVSPQAARRAQTR